MFLLKTIRHSCLLVVAVSCQVGCVSADKQPLNYANRYVEDFDLYWHAKTRLSPNMPVAAMRQELAGCVTLHVGVNTDGKTEVVSVVNAYPPGVFDQAAADAVYRLRWHPSDSNPDRKPALGEYNIHFHIDGREKNLAAYQQHCVSS